jgi:hypothetical protein
MPQQHDVCEQKEAIIHIGHTLKRMEKGQEAIAELLKITSNLTPRIEHLEDVSDRKQEDINNLYGRLRDVELVQAANGPAFREQFHDRLDNIDRKLDRTTQFVCMLKSKPARALYVLLIGTVLVGTLCDLMYHFDYVNKIVHIFK